MLFFQLAAAWLFPCAVCATMATTTVTAMDGASTVDKDRSSSPSFSTGGVKAGANPGSSPSPSASPRRSSSTSSLLGTRCGSPNSAHSPEKHGGAEAAPKGNAVRRCLRRLAKKLQRAARADDERPEADGRCERRRKSWSKTKTKPDRPWRAAGVVDGTTCEKEVAVASAIAYCKETMSRRRSGISPPPPSPSFNGWLMDRPEEEIRTACAAARCKFPALRRDVSLLEWLPEAPSRTSSAAVPHHRDYAYFDEVGGGDWEAGIAELPCRGAWE